MKVMAAGVFKARCLKVMDEVQATRQPVTITKKGRPVAKLVPPDVPPEDIFGCLKGEIEIVGDILSPVVPAEDWEALR
jgi:antitoxin (DNA-binding transcriptional repressor) of toxin-antitoxin stability system